MSRRLGHSDLAIHSFRDMVVSVAPSTTTVQNAGLKSSASVDVKTNDKAFMNANTRVHKCGDRCYLRIST